MASRRSRERGDKHDRWQDDRDADENDELPVPEDDPVPVHTTTRAPQCGVF